MDWFAAFITIKGGIPLLFLVLWLINASWAVNKPFILSLRPSTVGYLLYYFTYCNV